MAFRRLVTFLVVAAVLLVSAVGYASPTLKNGSRGQDVSVLQKKLQELGYAVKEVDGVFGDETKKAVESFQRDKKLKVTGVVNNSTWRTLRDIKSPPGTVKKHLLDKGKAQKVIVTAKKYIGTPYAMGGTTPEAFDCSGYLQYIFRENGINIPRTADEQYDRLGRHLKSRRDLVPGDLVFFADDSTNISHVGLYLGGNEFIHASSSKGVRIDALDKGYWMPRYYGASHIVK